MVHRNHGRLLARGYQTVKDLLALSEKVKEREKEKVKEKKDPEQLVW